MFSKTLYKFKVCICCWYAFYIAKICNEYFSTIITGKLNCLLELREVKRKHSNATYLYNVLKHIRVQFCGRSAHFPIFHHEYAKNPWMTYPTCVFQRKWSCSLTCNKKAILEMKHNYPSWTSLKYITKTLYPLLYV